MESFIVFLGQQWMLVGALLSCVLLLVFHDSKRSGASVSPQAAVNLINQQDAVVIDLRDAKEFKSGHIVDAINIPFSSVDSRLGELEAYKDKALILVCKMGQHSGGVGKKLAAKGFTGVRRMSGGMMEWKGQQLPLVKG
ncbi:MAG TPA: rhodanese-like domain-containing protein [Spongiibacteraceae bacterium]|nr:sulfurtransferase [Spongiibacteraceae bacterium]HCS28969.1 rhodanese-like domain-containing protein [Spongiibacteraceae bacterium]|tara:strand:- start:954 stop:1370 length:417 start_codon:yes stop_codon:yes gene_type:complete